MRDTTPASNATPRVMRVDANTCTTVFPARSAASTRNVSVGDIISVLLCEGRSTGAVGGSLPYRRGLRGQLARSGEGVLHRAGTAAAGYRVDSGEQRGHSVRQLRFRRVVRPGVEDLGHRSVELRLRGVVSARSGQRVQFVDDVAGAVVHVLVGLRPTRCAL